MKLSAILLLLSILVIGCMKSKPEHHKLTTVCNPMNLSYRFQPEEPSRREAADPTIVWYKDRYFLFASKSGGYWHSQNLIDWKFIGTRKIPVEDYAPTAVTIEDTLYFMASSHSRNTIYKSVDPLSGRWSIALDSLEMPVWDPALFLDEGNRLYLYWGCSNHSPIYGIELDYRHGFAFMGAPRELIDAQPQRFGWEVPGDYNDVKDRAPWIEGAWMNKIAGRYYLQYSAPGTEFKSYCDGVYTSDSPLGPFSPAGHNPFAYKPEGFADGAGHGSTFADRHGNFWHVGTVTSSQKHIFERRLALFPVFMDEDGLFYTSTRFGDYPMEIPDRNVTEFTDLFPGWMLLSRHKAVSASSTLDSLPAQNMVDENIRTYWAAASGQEGEWAAIDLGRNFQIYAVQVNFAEHNTRLLNRNPDKGYRYLLEYSDNQQVWHTLADRTADRRDFPHDYLQLPQSVNGRYIRITNREVPDGHFALSGLRVFGRGAGHPPVPVDLISVNRDPADRRGVRLTWHKADTATGYNIAFGLAPEKLYGNYLVYGDTVVTINSLDAERKYYFAVEAFNESGVAAPGAVSKAE